MNKDFVPKNYSHPERLAYWIPREKADFYNAVAKTYNVSLHSLIQSALSYSIQDTKFIRDTKSMAKELRKHSPKRQKQYISGLYCEWNLFKRVKKKCKEIHVPVSKFVVRCLDNAIQNLPV